MRAVIHPTGNPARGRRRKPTECGDECVLSCHARRAWQAVLMRTRSLNHSTYRHMYHLVWGTKYRRWYLKEYVCPEFLRCMYSLERKDPTLHFFSINADEDHVHLQVEMPPRISVAVAVQRMKAHSSIALKKRFRFIRGMYGDGNIWSVGYFSSTVGLNEETIRRYVEHQGKKDLPQQPSFVLE